MSYWMRLLLLTLLLSGGSLQAEPLQKRFTGWQLSCNNLNVCDVRSLPGQQGLALGKGTGDCGWRSRWQYNGKAFVLAEYAGQSECDNWQGSNNWPNLWQTRAVID